MTEVKRLKRPHGRRPRNAQATRAAILAAARAQFARRGYDHVALRDIAAAAHADVALVKRYFGGKEALFTDALKATFDANWVGAWDRSTFPAVTAELMAGDTHSNEEGTHTFQFLLVAATSPTTAPLLSVALQERFLAPIREWLGGRDAQPRARLFAATFIGFLVERLIRDEPLKGRERAVFIARAREMFEALVN